jgi:glycerol-3-phosphate O-acyltransferase / dihydroxyacetone phosphate acyltransferase
MATPSKKIPKEDPKLLVPWVYDLGLWMLSILTDTFFREVFPRGAWRVPRRGPVILVAAPHANQFVDPILLMRVVRAEAKRRISFLIAAKSMKRKFIGAMAGRMGALSVSRAMDEVKPAKGKIFLPDQDNDPTLIRGIGTDFTNGDFQKGGLIVLPKVRDQTPSTDIAEVLGPTELRLKKPFKTPEALQLLTQEGSGGSTPGGSGDGTGQSKGTKFKVAPHVDQSKVYDTVFQDLIAGGCIGMFPEGGSHDRPDLLPLKAGVAIMALGALAADPDCGLKIIPCGMNYFHAHKFRSRAVIEFGHPIEVHPDQIEAYKAGDRRNAVGSLLETIYQGLVAVTQLSPDYDTLMLVQAARRLYNPTGKKLPLPLVVELNRRLVKGYTQYKDDPRIVQLKKDVNEYNRRLRALGIKDHQVEWGNVHKKPWWLIMGTLFYRIGEILILTIGTLPGLALFWPVFVTTKVISIRKSKEALAASAVKLQGRDVITTWKLLVAIAFAPALYLYYTIVVSAWLSYNRHDGYYTNSVPWWMVARTYIPDFVPMWLFSISFFILMVAITFAALRIGEIGMDILKSLPPLFVALNPRSSSSLVKLRARRKALSAQVTEVINTLGPEVFPDFDAERIVADPYREGAYQSRYKRMPDTHVTDASEPGTPGDGGPAYHPSSIEDPSPTSKSFGLLPRNESFHNIGGFGFFASRPATPSKSRSRSSSAGGGVLSGSMPLKAFSSINTKESLDEVSKRIRGAMQERGKERSRRQSEGESSWDMADTGSGAETPGSEGEGGLQMGTGTGTTQMEGKKDR